MPLEIRELIIKASVGDGGGTAEPAAPDQSETDSEYLVNLCVEKVLEILKDKMER